jgi:hypothetical protein
MIRAGFNPVFYTLDDTPLVRSIYRGLSSLRTADVARLDDIAQSLEWDIDQIEDTGDLSTGLTDLRDEAQSLGTIIETGVARVQQLMAFVKTFRRSEFSTIYCEREWRSTAPFRFSADDLAMVVVPKLVAGREYFRPFVERIAPRLKLPRRVAVVAWDDLIEH